MAPGRSGQLALRLVTISAAFGLASGAVSVVLGLSGHSLGVLAVGLGVLADVTGSAVLIWRFRAELACPSVAGKREGQSAVIVAIALAAVAIILIVESIAALVAGTRPAASAATVGAAAISLVVLTPLAIAKRRLGRRMGSVAPEGDGALSGIGAATSCVALAALILYPLLGSWWADRATALVVAGIAATEAWRISSSEIEARGSAEATS